MSAVSKSVKMMTVGYLLRLAYARRRSKQSRARSVVAGPTLSVLVIDPALCGPSATADVNLSYML